MTLAAQEPVKAVKSRRDQALAALVAGVPYIQFLGIRFDRRGDEITAVLPFDDKLIGNPMIPALHGGVTAAFMEVAAIIELAWSSQWLDMEAGVTRPMRLPKTIDFNVDYLRAGLARDAYARAVVTRSGRRFASVQVQAWQDNRAKPFAMASAHFLMPEKADALAPNEGESG